MYLIISSSSLQNFVHQMGGAHKPRLSMSKVIENDGIQGKNACKAFTVNWNIVKLLCSLWGHLPTHSAFR